MRETGGSGGYSAHMRTRNPLPLKSFVFLLLWLALIAQGAWMATHYFRSHASVASMWYPLVFLVACLLLAATWGRVRWIAAILRILIAAAFLQAVCDRFGVFGGPGTPGVAWGDFSHFVAYTARVNSFLPLAMIPAVAVLATIAEIFCGVTMLLGIRLRAAALASAILLFLFATAMTISGLSQFSYAVYLMCIGALVLATVNASLLSVDTLAARKKS